MKARHIKELRKVIANFKEYEVSYSSGLFGDFGVKAGECCKKIMARNSQEAVERYLKWYFRKYKCRNRHHTNNLAETSRWRGNSSIFSWLKIYIYRRFKNNKNIYKTIMKVKFKKLHPGARLPEKATEGSAAYDLYTAEDIIVEPGRSIIPLGFAMEMEPGYEALVDPRSGFSCRGMEGHEVESLYEYKAPNGVTITGLWNPNIAMSIHVMDCVTRKCIDLEPKNFDCDVIEGKIDSDYRKGVCVIINSRDKRTFLIKAGTRIAQMTFHKVETVQWEEAEELSETERDGGFGSTGTK